MTHKVDVDVHIYTDVEQNVCVNLEVYPKVGVATYAEVYDQVK